MLDDLWFTGRAGQKAGPFSTAEMLEFERKGDLKPGTLVWRPGLQNWQPSAVHFRGGDAYMERNAASPRAPARQGNVYALIAFVTFIALAAALYYFDVAGVNFQKFGDNAAIVHAGAWLGATVAIIAANVAAWPRRGGAWPIAKVTSILALASAFAFVFVLARTSYTIYQVSQARKTFANFQLSYAPADRAIRFHGTIGPGFTDQLESILTANAGVQTLRVDSPGGLVDEALDAAHLIERTPGLSVEVDGECNSACIALFLASASRRADVMAQFGFHRGAFITQLPTFVQAAATEHLDQYRQYVLSHGFPAAVFDDYSKGTTVHSVTAMELADLHLVSTLLYDRQPVDIAQAKWLWVAAATHAANNGFEELSRSLALSGDRMLLDGGDNVFRAARFGAMSEMKSAVLGLLPVVIAKVMESADPNLARSYMIASSQSVGYLALMQQWQECASVVDGHGTSNPGAFPDSMVRAELIALAQAVDSSSRAGWIHRPLPSWAADIGRRDVTDAIVAVRAEGLDTRQFATDARTKCVFTQELMTRIEREDPVHAVVAYRWVSAQH